jgi:hypothetical protein
MRQVNKREKKILTPGLIMNPRSSAYTLSAVPLRHHDLHRKLYIYKLFLASAIYDCVNTYTIVHGQGTVTAEPYLLFNTMLTIDHGIDHGYQPELFNCNTILQCNTSVSRAPHKTEGLPRRLVGSKYTIQGVSKKRQPLNIQRYSLCF